MTKKKIKILTTGVIKVKGFINGPVLTPYFEDLNTIFALVSAGVKVVEVCDDGAEITLTPSNFSDDHSKASREAVEAEAKAKALAAATLEAEKAKKKADSEAKKKKEESDKAKAVRENEERAQKVELEKTATTDEVQYSNNYNNYKKNKKNNHNNVTVEAPQSEPINLNK